MVAIKKSMLCFKTKQKKHVTRSLLLLHWLDVVPDDVGDKVEVCGRIGDVTDVVTGCTIEDEED